MAILIMMDLLFGSNFTFFNFNDLGAVSDTWQKPGYATDLNDDGITDAIDFDIFLQVWREGQWLELYHEIGYPAGLRHMMTLELTDKLLPTDQRLRMRKEALPLYQMAVDKESNFTANTEFARRRILELTKSNSLAPSKPQSSNISSEGRVDTYSEKLGEMP